MTVEETVKYNLINYPSLYGSRWDVLYKILISYGTGYQWVNGQMKSNVGDVKQLDVKEGVERAFEYWLNDKKLVSTGISYLVETCKDNVLAILDWENRSQIFNPENKKQYVAYKHAYPCKASPIMSIPEDVKPDWRKAAYEIYHWIITHPEQMREETAGDRQYMEQIKFPFQTESI